MPRHVGQVPLTYRHHPTGGRSNWKVDYVDGSVTPAWPFGHGRSYTTCTIEALRVDHHELDTAGDVVTVRVDVTNTGRRAGDEVVQLYVRDEEASVARPVIELRGFRRVHLDAGRVPDGDVPAVDRGARLHRRRLPARRRARARPPVRRPLVRGPAARPRSCGSSAARSSWSSAAATSPRRATPARADASTSGAAGGSPFDVSIARPPSIAGHGRPARCSGHRPNRAAGSTEPPTCKTSPPCSRS